MDLDRHKYIIDKIGIPGLIHMVLVLTEICHNTYCTFSFNTLKSALHIFLICYAFVSLLKCTMEKIFKDKEICTTENELYTLSKLKKRSPLFFGGNLLTK